MAEKEKRINCLLVPLGQRTLLLPQTAMAEIIRQPRIEPFAWDVPWMLGRLPWRGMKIPVAELELLCAEFNPNNTMAQVIVLHSIKTHVLDFYAFVTASIPRPVRVLAKDLNWANEPDICPIAAASVVLSEQELIIPDLLYLEGRVLDAFAAGQ